MRKALSILGAGEERTTRAVGVARQYNSSFVHGVSKAAVVRTSLEGHANAGVEAAQSREEKGEKVGKDSQHLHSAFHFRSHFRNAEHHIFY